ncbi:MAG: carboxypeptidase regulatory-like domain-containing protein [Candidatus Sumerlaeota bacterium]|nr:carboxypeptidase regulatory-like domain-containing protein [Candidatus Sumerlaeota bacterium]
MNRYYGRIIGVVILLAALIGIAVWSVNSDLPGNAGFRGTVVHILARGRSALSRLSGSVSSLVLNPAKSSHKSHNGNDLKPSAETMSSCTLSGNVNNEIRAPVKDARVTVRGANGLPDKTASTDESGHYQVTGISAGSYDILAAHPQYSTLVRPGFTFTTDDQAVELNFQLPLGATIKGLITDEENKPITGARASAHRRQMEQLRAGGNIFLDNASYKTVQTDKDGTFALTGVSTGENLFEFSRSGYETETRKINVNPDKTGEQLAIVLKKTGRIAGTVIDEDGNPVGTSTIRLTRYKPFGAPAETFAKDQFNVTADAKGHFSFTKLFNDGFYDLEADHPDYAPGMFPLAPSGSLQVACTLTRGGGIEGRTEMIDRPTTPVSVVVCAETVIKETTFTAQTKSDGNGRYKFARLPYGAYKLTADSASLVCEPKTGIGCSKGSATKDIVLEVYEATVAGGRVLDVETNTYIEGAEVAIQASYGPGQIKSRSFKTVSGNHGRFDFNKLPAGLHVAQASAQGFMRTSSGASAQTFTLQPGERKNDIVLQLDHGGSVEGFVIDPAGRSVIGCVVQLYLASAVPRSVNVKDWNSTTDESGYFKITGIEAGERLQLYASAAKPGCAKTRSSLITLTAQQPAVNTQITLQAGCPVSGKITDLKDLPIPGAEVAFTTYAFPGDPTAAPIKVYAAANGSYLIPNCTPGTGQIKVSRSGYVEESRDLALKTGRSFDGVNFQLDFGCRISGRVTSLDGYPIASARVKARPLQGSSGNDEAITNKNGEYTLTNLGKGKFHLEASFKLPGPDGEQNYVFAESSMQSPSTSADIDCDVANYASGLVVDSAHKRVDNFTVTLNSHNDTQPTQDFKFNLSRNCSSARGFYRFANVPRGVYTMRVTSGGYEDSQSDSIFVGPGKRTVLPNIRLRTAGGVMGTVVSSATRRPVNDVIVKIYEYGGKSRQPMATARTDYSGRFRAASMGTGIYQIEMEHPNYVPLQLGNISVLQKKATDIGQVVLEAGGTVQGTVTDESGDPVQSVEVRVSGQIPGKMTWSDAAGNFILQGVKPGRWPVVAEGYINDRKVYTFQHKVIQPDDPAVADFMLETSADLDGMITASESGGVRSGSVRIHPFDEYSNVLEDVHYDSPISAQNFLIKAVPPGPYFLWSTGWAATAPFSLWQQLFLDRGRNYLTAPLSPGAVRGTAALSQGLSGVPGIALQLLPIIDGIRLPQSIYNALIRTAITDQNGLFQFNNLQRGAYQLLYQNNNTPSSWFALPSFFLSENQKINNYVIPLGQ